MLETALGSAVTLVRPGSGWGRQITSAESKTGVAARSPAGPDSAACRQGERQEGGGRPLPKSDIRAASRPHGGQATRDTGAARMHSAGQLTPSAYLKWSLTGERAGTSRGRVG